MIETSTNAELVAKIITESLDEKNAQNIKVLNLKGLDSAISDYFIICNSKNSVHGQTLADWVMECLHKDLNDKPFNVEGKDQAEWILMDYVNVVVHIFSEEKRQFIKLDDLWADAKEENFLTANQKEQNGSEK
jgi:ribosome-associated protein